MFSIILFLLPGTSTTSRPSTLSPADKAVVSAYTDIFTSTDTAATKAALIQQLSSLGLSSETLGSYVDTIQSFATVLSPNPTPQQTAEFPEKIKKVTESVLALVESQPGLQNFTTDPKFQNDSSAQVVLQRIEFGKKIISTLNVTAAYELYVTNAATTFAGVLEILKTVKSVSDKVSTSEGNFKFLKKFSVTKSCNG
jgi:hypothetical protein